MKYSTFGKLQTPKGEFSEERMAPWRRDYDKKILKMIADQKPMPADIIKAHYAQGNAIFRSRVEEYEKEHGRVPDPKPYDYKLAKKKCTDARQMTESLGMFLTMPIIHENTAGSIVREGHVFKVLSPDGFGVVEGHFACGAMGVAHQFHNGTFEGEPNEHVKRIANSIPPAVAAPSNPSIRDRRNAIHQTAMARFTLEDAGKTQPIFSTFITWEHGIDYQWLKGMPVSELPSQIENDVRLMFDYALAEGRNFGPQYSTMTVIYDPYRLGRFNDPRIVMDGLMNELFCVTFDFRRLGNGHPRPLSRTGMGSLIYANFHKDAKGHHGHVEGVGGANGTHTVGIMDTDPIIIERVKNALLSDEESGKQISELTDNGKKILPIKYDTETRLITFL